MYRGSKIAVVVPAYNEEELILETLEGIPPFVDRIYAVNDGSTDSTMEKIAQRSAVDRRVVPIDHHVNKGVGAALITGYKASVKDDMDVTAVMAGDNQMDPRFLPSLLDPIIDGKVDYTKGNRLFDADFKKGMSTWRLFGNTMLTLLTKFSTGHYNISDPQNGYTAIRNTVFQTIDPDSLFPWYGYCNDILMRLKVHRFTVIDVDIPARYGRERSAIPYPEYVARVSRLLLVNFILRLGMKKAVMHPRTPAPTSVFGGVLFLGGLLTLVVHPFEVANISLGDLRNEMIWIALGAGAVLLLYGHIITTASKRFIVPHQDD